MVEKIKFEDALKRLEEIVHTLESGVDELDKIVNLFEEGSELSKYCNEKLEKVENKIEDISQRLNKVDEED
jgi:exodeoxyribonuclease VII small subunit